MSITKALIIVDMQEDFLDRMSDSEDYKTATAAYKKLMKGILREVEVAIKNRLPIVCLQYANQEDGFDHPATSWAYHATTYEIRKALKGYSRVYFAWKDEDGGGDEIYDVLHGVEPLLGVDKPSYRGKPNKLRKFITDEHEMIDFTVVGVNASACVAATCGELVDMGHRCRVPADAALNVWDCAFADDLDDCALDFDGVRITNMVRGAAA